MRPDIALDDQSSGYSPEVSSFLQGIDPGLGVTAPAAAASPYAGAAYNDGGAYGLAVNPGDPGSNIIPDPNGNPPAGTAAVAAPSAPITPPAAVAALGSQLPPGMNPAPPQTIAPPHQNIDPGPATGPQKFPGAPTILDLLNHGAPPTPAPLQMIAPPQQSLPTPALSAPGADPFANLGSVSSVGPSYVAPYAPTAQATAATVNAPGAVGSVSNVGAPPTPDAYRTALEQALTPAFQDQQNSLAAKEAAMGILDSGGARKDFSDLTARQNATIAQELEPLIQQGFGQQFQANAQNAQAANAQLGQLQDQAYGAAVTNAQNRQATSAYNAGALNSDNQLLTGLGFQGQESAAARALSASNANAGYRNALNSQLEGIGAQMATDNANRTQQQTQFDEGLTAQGVFRNQDAQNALLMEQLGFANQNYGQGLSAYSSLLGQGLGSLGSILGAGQRDQFSGYTLPQQLNPPYAAALGQSRGYGAGARSGSLIQQTGEFGGLPIGYGAGTAQAPTSSTDPYGPTGSMSVGYDNPDPYQPPPSNPDMGPMP